MPLISPLILVPQQNTPTTQNNTKQNVVPVNSAMDALKKT